MKRTTKTQHRNAGIKGHTITPHTIKGKNGWVLNYSHHGSSYVHAEEFTELEKLNARLAELKGAK